MAKKRLLLGVAKTGRTETLEEYYLQKRDADEFTVIGQSTWSVPDRSYVRHYNKLPEGYLFNKYENQIRVCHIHYKPLIWLKWFWNVITNLGGKYDECIAVSQSFGFIGVLLKKIGLVKKLVYYCIDYYNNEPIVAWMDSCNCRYADEVWDISERINPKRKKPVKSRIVPLSFTDAHLNPRIDVFMPHRLVFVGCLMPNQGLDILCQAMPLITQKYPDCEALVIGEGSYGEEVRKMRRKDHNLLNIRMLGFIDNERELCERVSSGAIGLAMFTLKGNSNILCADPGKIKLYAMCGLPVITTKHYKYEFGIMAEETPESLFDAVDYLFSNPDLLMEYRKRSYEWGKQWTTNRIMGEEWRT